ncbi:DUF4269 domain-containing protein [Pseudobacteriovorax antillogorgiicola]|uniref:DUF4269 domain-containing protein n=1 Tax=Pseudobacteriovorax antillogorgiicola TaxID=1513793 RepID=A0A1Y6BXE3_9BACT|nr:DUF4269 domain-containing protein [Pseudobacteriovorax antillogorgiicola]TCS53102.1 uncharacterized protein DUF4269 [Pseudobacteriovorax antillogorgiicola]SMF25758.1 protein of unknown function [Pseudobacteriovorax antillogorgiicola]
MSINDISFMKAGTPRQRLAFAAITSLGILEKLEPHNAVLAGTIPIDVDIEDSDLDIICEANDLDDFNTLVLSYFGDCDEFTSYMTSTRGVKSFVARFAFSGFGFEIFAQNCPIERQYAVVHLLVERRLLEIGGDTARDGIRSLKARGLKTEPAFAKYFGIPGDPYEELVKLVGLSDRELEKFVQSSIDERSFNSL